MSAPYLILAIHSYSSTCKFPLSFYIIDTAALTGLNFCISAFVSHRISVFPQSNIKNYICMYTDLTWFTDSLYDWEKGGCDLDAQASETCRLNHTHWLRSTTTNLLTVLRTNTSLLLSLTSTCCSGPDNSHVRMCLCYSREFEFRKYFFFFSTLSC